MKCSIASLALLALIGVGGCSEDQIMREIGLKASPCRCQRCLDAERAPAPVRAPEPEVAPAPRRKPCPGPGPCPSPRRADVK